MKASHPVQELSEWTRLGFVLDSETKTTDLWWVDSVFQPEINSGLTFKRVLLLPQWNLQNQVWGGVYVLQRCSFMWKRRMLTADASPAGQLQQMGVNQGGELRRWEEEAAAPHTSSHPITMMTYSAQTYRRLLAAYSLIQGAVHPPAFISSQLFFSSRFKHFLAALRVSRPASHRLPSDPPMSLASFLRLLSCPELLQRQAVQLANSNYLKLVI